MTQRLPHDRAAADVRVGSDSEVALLARHVRCTLNSGRR